MVVGQHALLFFFFLPLKSSFNNKAARRAYASYASQLFTETNVAEGRMNLRIASWRFGTMSLAHANMVSLLPLIISGLCLDFTLLHLHTTW